MEVERIREICKQAYASGASSVVLRLKRRRSWRVPRHGRVRLFGARGPQGLFLERDGETIVCEFQPRAVLKWFWKQEPWDTRDADGDTK